IEPAVVVVVDGGETPAALPAEIGEGDALETFAVDIAPEADAGSARVREGEIHPAVLVEIEGHDADSGREIFFFEIDRGQRSEFSFARIEIDGCAVGAAGKNKIDGAVVVEIGGDQAGAGGVEAQTGFGRDICERAVAIIAPEKIVRRRFGCGSRCRLHGDVQIEIAVVVVVDKSDADAAFFAANADFFGDVFKFSVAVVVKKTNAVRETNGKICVAVVIEITRGAAEATAGEFEAGFPGDVGEFSVAEIVEEAAGAVGGGADEEEVGFAVAIVIEEADASARSDWRGTRERGQPRPYCRETRSFENGCNGLWREAHGNGGWRILRAAAREFCKGEAALI